MKAFLFILILFISFPSYSQKSGNGKVVGIVRDVKTQSPLQFASIGVLRQKDSSYVSGGMSDSTGFFRISSIPYGTYYLKIVFLGYEPLKTMAFSLNQALSQRDFGIIRLKRFDELLPAANIVSKQILLDLIGDTMQYHADAFKTNPDATAEDLLNKMPGVTSNPTTGAISVNGEQVTQVTVDGKPFYGDDPTMAIRNLPAEVIDKIQVFDKQTDQALFTGFDDGQSSKTINIITKAGKSNGVFGKFFSGYGDDGRYIEGGNLNIFDGNRRISILGLSNNINQQNFSTQDLLGVMGGRGGRGGGGGGSGGGGASSAFLVSPQSGINTTTALGINYSDVWDKNIKVTASYFYNVSDNSTITDKNRIYVSAFNNGLLYNETDSAKSTNYNQRFNMRLEYTIDTANSLILTPKINVQNNTSGLGVFGQNLISNGSMLQSETSTNTPSFTAGYDFANTILWRHKFKKKGRTFSTGLSSDLNNKYGNGSQYSVNSYFIPSDTATTINQDNPVHSSGYMLSPNLVYTEPVDSFGQMQFSYNPSYTVANTNQPTNNYSMMTQNYASLDTALSNQYQSIYTINKAGIGYRRNKKKFMIMAGVNFQYATVSGNENLPVTFAADKSFKDILPQATINYRFAKGTNLRIIYRATTNLPSISQLQSVINNNNPLFLSIGNPALRQDYEQTITARYGKTRNSKASGLFLYLYANYTQNYIGSQTIFPVKDTLVGEGILLKAGGQLIKPVNINGYLNTKSFATYALPISKIKCNLNLNSGFNYTQTPGLVNDATNINSNYALSGGIGLSSNISEKIDFNFSYTGNYNIVKNSLTTATPNNNYFSQLTTLKFNWLFWNGFVLNTSLSHTLYAGLSQNYNLDFLLWNVSLGYKLLKNHSLEVKASIFDLLNENNSISRTITNTYIEDDRSNVLNEYYMLTLTYTIRNYRGAKT